MELIVHIGAPKTGTTAIQHALSRNRDQLAAHGILYPKTAFSNINHTILTAGLLGPEWPLGRLVIPYVDDLGKTREQVFKDEMEYIRKQVREHKSDRVLLSTEALFRRMSVLRLDRLMEELDVKPENVSFICYIRNPADHYLSLAQQRLKHSSRFKVPKPSPFRDVLEGYIKDFGERMIVRLYDSRYLLNGDSVADLMSLVEPRCPLEREGRARRNETVSAEIMEIVQDYRRAHYPDDDNVPMKDVNKLWNMLRKMEARLWEPRKPRLRNSVRQDVIRKSLDDIRWLKEYLGQEIDWENELTDDSTPCRYPPSDQLQVSDVCEVDPGRKNELMMRLIAKQVRKKLRR